MVAEIVYREWSRPEIDAEHYGGGDTILTEQIRSGEVPGYWTVVERLPPSRRSPDGRVAAWPPLGGRRYSSREDAERAVAAVAEADPDLVATEVPACEHCGADLDPAEIPEPQAHGQGVSQRMRREAIVCPECGGLT
jgi:hypothetical protein